MLRLTCSLYLERAWSQPAKVDTHVLSVPEQDYGAVNTVDVPEAQDYERVSVFVEASPRSLSRHSSRNSVRDPVSVVVDTAILSRSVSVEIQSPTQTDSLLSESLGSEEERDNKRDSKMYTKEDESIVLPPIDEEREDSDEGRTSQKVPQAAMVDISGSPPVPPLHISQSVVSSPSNSLPPTPASIRPSSTQSKIAKKRRTFTGKLKRALSVSKRNSM